MIRARSVRDRERIDYEMGRSIEALRDAATILEQCQFHERARRLRSTANDLERASEAKPTGFDHFGGRAVWLSQQKERAA